MGEIYEKLPNHFSFGYCLRDDVMTKPERRSSCRSSCKVSVITVRPGNSQAGVAYWTSIQKVLGLISKVAR
jgi:hypothetical protein